MFLSKYGVARVIEVPVIKRAVVDFAVSADWTPVAGDVKITKDGGAAANVTNLPTALTMGNGAIWSFSLTATEMQAARVVVTVVDAATKAVEDQSFIIETYGNASAQHAADFSDSTALGLSRLDAAITSRMATYTQPTGFLAATFPTGTVANTTNITAATGITVSTNSDKTGYSLTQTFPANFSAMAITAGGVVSASGNWSIAGDAMTLTAAYNAAKTASQAGDAMALTAAYDFAKGTTAVAEAYAADGAAFSPIQALYMIWATLAERNASGTTLTVKKLDGTTTAMTFTLDAASPTSQTRAT